MSSLSYAAVRESISPHKGCYIFIYEKGFFPHIIIF